MGLVRNGANVVAVKGLLGHKRLSTPERYRRPWPRPSSCSAKARECVKRPTGVLVMSVPLD
jgi:hypothetical protein